MNGLVTSLIRWVRKYNMGSNPIGTTMKRVYSDSEKEFVEAVVGLFILLPNPQLKNHKEMVMKYTYQVLDDIDWEAEIEDDGPLSKEEIEVNDWYYKYIMQSEEYEEE